ncbi:MAG: hydroxymethylglutaryl-CoA lyase [Hyphomicrobiales bacterium]|jgi:hydroxymethylglutaryl-CoA lyase|nr:hydroxymethylglutaryl-CoA lyase [Methylobacterium sp.]MCE2932651.1 hydroxymethylglutaryl-CoA lyase [Hyphomicrobiales bacterium]MCA3639803.1 hydroxymethylglutaryl-CoA lyase [Methylobacterium sp.]MCA3647433.1 hydroxymethylglutaryl-CoA lyase [Methylobacterium sp.]MCA3653617.1 hydroxymethylglutaryl-CoA lyase [Methylobacterium sp.]
MKFPRRVRIVEVAPRDGLQSLSRTLPTAEKIWLVDTLSALGFGTIEVTGFVSPRAIPNLADADAVMAGIMRRSGTLYRGLAPNRRGAERAVAAGCDEIVGLVTASEGYTARNQNMTLTDALTQALASHDVARGAGCRFVLAIGMAFFCPYDGAIDESRVLGLIDAAWEAGVRSVYLAGSLGLEHPREVQDRFGRIRARWPGVELGYHVHDMGGMAAANTLCALEAGIDWLETAICGIGGGVATPTATGNYPTEDMVRMLSDCGIETGLDARAVMLAAREISLRLGLPLTSAAGRCGDRSENLRAPTTPQPRQGLTSPPVISHP